MPAVYLNRAFRYLTHYENAQEPCLSTKLVKINEKGQRRVQLDDDRMFEVVFGKPSFTAGAVARYGQQCCDDGLEWVKNIHMA